MGSALVSSLPTGSGGRLQRALAGQLGAAGRAYAPQRRDSLVGSGGAAILVLTWSLAPLNLPTLGYRADRCTSLLSGASAQTGSELWRQLE